MANTIWIETSKSDSGSISEPATVNTMSVEEMKAELIRLTNIERKKAGVQELEVMPQLMESAQCKADDMLEHHYFDHDSPTYGTIGHMIKDRIPDAKSAGENLASWTKTPEEAIYGLMNSPAHKANMLDAKYTHIGVGIIDSKDGGYWWVQQFVKM